MCCGFSVGCYRQCYIRRSRRYCYTYTWPLPAAFATFAGLPRQLRRPCTPWSPCVYCAGSGRQRGHSSAGCHLFRCYVSARCCKYQHLYYERRSLRACYRRQRCCCCAHCLWRRCTRKCGRLCVYPCAGRHCQRYFCAHSLLQRTICADRAQQRHNRIIYCQRCCNPCTYCHYGCCWVRADCRRWHCASHLLPSTALLLPRHLLAEALQPFHLLLSGVVLLLFRLLPPPGCCFCATYRP